MRFTMDEEIKWGRLQALLGLIVDQELHAEPCELLSSQLNELQVILNKTIKATVALQTAVDRRVKIEG